jgi:hypothetical protein
MENLPAARGWLEPPTTLLAICAWLGVVLVAIRLRRHNPWLLFGLVFFLVGHVLESSFIHLELYFAHRNYVPAFGLCFALVWAVWQIPAPYRRFARIGLAGYILALTLILAEVTLTWSQPARSAPQWLAHNPYSERGVQFMLEQQFAAGEIEQAKQLIRTTADLLPNRPLLQIQLSQVCENDPSAYAQTLSQVEHRLRTALYQPEAARELVQAVQHYPRSPLCPLSGPWVLDALAAALLENPHYSASPTSASLLELTRALARIHHDASCARHAGQYPLS